MSERVHNVTRNFFLGGIAKILMIVFPFITKTIFIKLLGEEYLGISGLFSSILTLLNMSELGLSYVVVYSLYKPIADKDNSEIASLLEFYKGLYRKIALFIAVVGAALIPFLGFFVNSPIPLNELRVYYLLYLLDQVASYLYIWKSTLIEADQKMYIVTAAKTAFTIGMQVAQMIVLLATHNFLLYLITQLTFTILNNVYVSWRADQMYADINKAEKHPLPKEQKQQIFSDVRSYFTYKIGGVFLNSTDSLYISKMINTRTVGYYSNYLSLSSALTTLAAFIDQSLIHTVGDYNVNHTQKEKKQLFDELVLLFTFVGVVLACGFWGVSSSIIQAWLGDRFMVDQMTVFAMSMNIFIPIMLYPVWMYRNTTGMFRQTRDILLYAGICNLFLSYILGKRMGLAGILLATSLSRVLTSFWFEPYILFKYMFKDYHLSGYFISVIKAFFTALLSCFIYSRVIVYVGITGWLGVLVRIIISAAISLILLVLVNFLNPNFMGLMRMMKSALHRRK